MPEAATEVPSREETYKSFGENKRLRLACTWEGMFTNSTKAEGKKSFPLLHAPVKRKNRQTQRQIETDRDRYTERDTETDRQRDKQRQRDRDREKQIYRQRQTARERERETDRFRIPLLLSIVPSPSKQITYRLCFVPAAVNNKGTLRGSE